MKELSFEKGKLGFLLCNSDSGKVYKIDTENLSCECPGFFSYGYKKKGFLCKHLKGYLSIKESMKTKRPCNQSVQCSICKEWFPKRGIVGHMRWHDSPENSDYQEEHRKKICLSHKHRPAEEKKRIGIKLSKGKLGGKNPNWKGEDINVQSKHGYLRRNNPQPEACQICGKKPRVLDLAFKKNSAKPEEYTKNIKDYRWICRKCHLEIDGRLDRSRGRLRNPTEETRKKMSIAHIGKTLSKRQKEAMSRRMKGRDNPFYGKTHDLKTREKMRNAWVIRREKLIKRKA